VIDSDNGRERDFPEDPPREQIDFDQGVDLGVDGSTHEHAQNASNRPSPMAPAEVPGQHPKRPKPTDPENQTPYNVCSQISGLYLEFDQSHVFHQVNTYHSNQDGGKHKFNNSEILKLKSPHDLFIFEDLALLKKKPEDKPGHEAKKQFPPRLVTSGAISFPSPPVKKPCRHNASDKEADHGDPATESQLTSPAQPMP